MYYGRWGGLRPVQKAEFVVELVFFALLVGSLVYNSYIRDGSVLPVVVSFGAVVSVGMSNVLSEAKRQQVIALGHFRWRVLM